MTEQRKFEKYDFWYKGFRCSLREDFKDGVWGPLNSRMTYRWLVIFERTGQTCGTLRTKEEHRRVIEDIIRQQASERVMRPSLMTDREKELEQVRAKIGKKNIAWLKYRRDQALKQEPELAYEIWEEEWEINEKSGLDGSAKGLTNDDLSPSAFNQTKPSNFDK